jgi:hypothetical protein
MRTFSPSTEEVAMSPFEITLGAVLALSVLSGAAATIIVLAVDTSQRPGARRVAAKLMEMALLGAVALAALLA